MFLILASMSGLNLLTKHTSTPQISSKLFPWPPLLTALSFLSAEIASVFFTGQEVQWQHKTSLGFNFILVVVASMDICLWVECAKLGNQMLRVRTMNIYLLLGKSYISTQTLKVTITKDGNKSNKIMGAGKERSYKVTLFCWQQLNSQICCKIRNTSNPTGELCCLVFCGLSYNILS